MRSRSLKMYRIGVVLVVIFILTAAVVKISIWSFSSLSSQHQNFNNGMIHPITVLKHSSREAWRYTTVFNQKVFYKIESLFTPAFISIFVLMAVRLIKIPNIFQKAIK